MRQLLPILAFVTVVAMPLAARQEVHVSGPRPEVRALIDAFTSALGGSPEAWETMAAQHFAPEFLAKHPPAARRQIYDRLRKDFANAKRGPVRREGPDAPLQLQMVGANGPVGAIVLGVTSATVPLIISIDVDKGGSGPSNDPSGPPRPPLSGKMTKSELASAADGYLRTLSADGRFSGTALIAREGEVWFEQAYGLANRSTRTANTTETRFNIGSINKAFTRAAIEQLIAQKKLSRTDTLGGLIPDYPQALSRTATIDQLLGHTAGIADFFGAAFNEASKDRFRSNADYFRFVSQLPPTFAPGARNQYCNGCYIVLGAIVERIAKMPYEQYVKEQVFVPAGMMNTGFLHVDSVEPLVAIGYTTRGGGGLRSNILMHGATGSAAGGSYSTVRDLLAFAAAQRSGRIPGGGMTRIAGGASGTNATLQSEGPWTVVVLTNLDPPFGEDVGGALTDALTSGR